MNQEQPRILASGTVVGRPMTKEAVDLQRRLEADQGGRNVIIADADGVEQHVFSVDAKEILRLHPGYRLVSGNIGS